MGQAGGRVGSHVSGVFLAGLSAGAVLCADNIRLWWNLKTLFSLYFLWVVSQASHTDNTDLTGSCHRRSYRTDNTNLIG